MNLYHVIFQDFEWVLLCEASPVPLAAFDLKQHAVEFSKLYARHYRGVLTIADPDHSIEERRDYSQNARWPDVRLVFATTP
jgi:hypothetical protein